MDCLLDQVPSPAFTRNASGFSRWNAIYTYPRHEKTVKACLDAKAMEVFLPTVTVQSRWKDRDMQLQLPAFPGYLFVRIPFEERGKVLSAPGVVRILSFNGVPAPIDNAEIDALRLCLERYGPLVKRHPFLGIGERVRVRAGASQGTEGWIIRKADGCRLVLSIGLIRQSVAVEVDTSLLEPLPQTPRMDMPKGNVNRARNRAGLVRPAEDAPPHPRSKHGDLQNSGVSE